MEAIRPPSYAAANRDIIRVMFKPSFLYLAGLGVSVALVGLLAFCLLHVQLCDQLDCPPTLQGMRRQAGASKLFS